MEVCRCQTIVKDTVLARTGTIDRCFMSPGCMARWSRQVDEGLQHEQFIVQYTIRAKWSVYSSKHLVNEALDWRNEVHYRKTTGQG